MLIKSQLRLAAFLPVFSALLIGAVLWVAAVKIDREAYHVELAEEVLRFNFQLNILTQEYLLYGGKRAETQLRIRHRSMDDLLASLPFEETAEREIVVALLQGQEELGSMYDLLLAGTTAARGQIAGALLIKGQDQRTLIKRYDDIQHRQIREFRQIMAATVMAAIVVLAVLSMLLLALMARRLNSGIARLNEGVGRVAAGDFEHRIASPTDDEIGALAHAFNAMSERLRDSYTSIDRLQSEVRKRQAVEREIQQFNAELEARVADRTAELEYANKELEAFSYSVSHDLRAPLRAIDGFSRKLLKGYGDGLDDEGRRLLHVVRKEALRMGTLIDELLAFSRMGRREMAWQALDMDAMVRRVVDELRTAEAERIMEFSLSPLPRVSGDAAMLRQVWVNLLGNAAKFTRLRPVAHITVGGCITGGEVLYWVKDDGAGFDMQYADKLFGVFQRLHHQAEFEGTGVGLAITQTIVHRHKGRIWAEGKPDAGATFWFALPLPEAQSSGEISP